MVPSGEAVPGRVRPHGKLGRDFWTLWSASTVSIVGDGLYLSALPLITLLYTDDPLQISLVTAASTLPWLLFGLIGGALVDRWDRLRIMWITDLARFAVVGGLALVLLTGHGSVAVLAVVAFLLATGETLYVTASQSVLPALVQRDPHQLKRANSRLFGAHLLARDFGGKPLGGALFSVAPGLPILIDAVSFAAGSALVGLIGRGERGAAGPSATVERQGLFRSVRAGMRWLWHNRLLRTLALLVAVGNMVTAAWMVLLALLARDRLGISGFGFGVLTACLGIGGALGSLVAVRCSDRFGLARTMVSVMLLEALATAGAGLAGHPVATGAMLLLMGASALVWNILTVTLRQTIVPDKLYGRVNSAFRLLAMGTAPLGAVLGGLAGNAFPLPVTFVLGGAVIAVAALFSVRVVNKRNVDKVVADAEVAAASSS
ncbi:MFS transporter [Amycolatopsis sp. QT-25]|uniref:MFS transporter n=1 Tax=Amycolatopsis sp. QT-25 TaxID=3034022 RepID=UPI0023EABF4D|nr:MFS transporter [Amycolatopsis sp. QT-25]WET81660.1 MFS transporter [Amycolatopsis sp. QT-25]